MKVPAQDQSIVKFEIAPRSLAFIIATIAAIWLAYKLWIVALILVMALILAGTFNPLVEWMERRGLGRTTALVVLFIALALTTSALVFLTVPPLIDQLTEMIKDAPATRTRLIALLSERSITIPLAHVVQGTGVAQMSANVERYVLGSASQALRVVGYAATTVVLAFYLLADGKRAQGVAYAFVPRTYHMRLARILQNMETIVGGYMRGQIVTCAAIGVFTFVLLVACGVPNALALSLFAALVDVIPFVGGFLVIAPAVLSALPRGLPIAGIVLVAFSLYMEFESRVLVPRIYGKALRLSSTAVILALVAGGILMGIVGALLALPIAAGLVMMVAELRVEMPGDDSVDRAELAKHEKTEATYEQMSAGTTAPEAGAIAKHLAADQREADLVEAAAHPPVEAE
jgi:predicted PurR-regulated permease PerM